MLPDRLAFVDIETTGTSASYGRIIEIGILRVEGNKLVQTYQSLINPQTHLPPEIELLTGITQRDLENKPTFQEVADEIRTLLNECIFVAHNARFDYSFLKHSFLRENIPFQARQLCTVKLSRSLFPTASHHNLDAVIQRCGIHCEQRHRAFDDASALWHFYQYAKKTFSEDEFLKAVNLALRRPTVPTKLSWSLIDSLPELPGVYIMYGSQSSVISHQYVNGITSQSSVTDNPQPRTDNLQPVPLYIGKSKNIRDRVLSHFSGDIRSTKEMSIAQQVEHIETIVTAGELGALFLEATLIKQKLPIYNRMLRVKHELIALRKVTNTKGYDGIELFPVQTITSGEIGTILGLFKSRKQAKNFLADVSKEYQLCEKLIGLEKTSTACFAYRLNKCKGACVGKESALFYNTRFVTAFSKTKIKPWPFTGPIIIDEKNEITGITEHFIIDKWCFIGSVKIDQEGNEDTSEIILSKLEAMPNDQNVLSAQNSKLDSFSNFGLRTSDLSTNYTFDLDMYKIIHRYLKDTKNMKKIRLLSDADIVKIYTSSSQYLT